MSSKMTDKQKFEHFCNSPVGTKFKNISLTDYWSNITSVGYDDILEIHARDSRRGGLVTMRNSRTAAIENWSINDYNVIQFFNSVVCDKHF